MKSLILSLSLLFSHPILSAPVVNIYVWGGEIPKVVIQQFEHETGIKVNFSTYDSNETMYAKLKASRTSIYDVILPSAYFVERMQKQNMLTSLDHFKIPELKNLDPLFFNNNYDKGNQFSVPLVWGLTGIFFNQKNISQPPLQWKQLWNKEWRNQLMLLDDSREVFAIALMSLGFNPNDTNALHIKLAYEHLADLVPNIKLFTNDSVQAIIIDEDANLGSAWNGDVFKARAENKAIRFIYPQEGFVIWTDCLAIPKNAPHLEEAYAFINFLLRPESAKQIAEIEGHAITNAKGRKLLPLAIQNDPMIYPSAEILARGYFQRDIGEETLALYNNYWEKLKLAF